MDARYRAIWARSTQQVVDKSWDKRLGAMCGGVLQDARNSFRRSVHHYTLVGHGDPRYRGVPLLLSRQRHSGSGEEREVCQSLVHLNLKMMGLDIQPAYESSFNQIARRLARSERC